MNSIESLTRILGLAFVSGINLYATVLMIGLGIRYHWVEGLPSDLTVLAHPAVLIVAAVLYALEFLADKIPVVSTFWDLIHTFVRPVGGALLALAALKGVHIGAPLQIVALLLGGTIALGAHSTKMGVRLLGHAAPNPILHAGVSMLEDVSVVGLLVLVYTHPLVALIVLAILIGLTALIGPLAFRVLYFAARAVWGRLMSWNSPLATLPPWVSQSVATVPAQAYFCFARSIPGVPRMHKGYLIDSPLGLSFVWKGWFGVKTARLEGNLTAPVSRGWMVDLLRLSGARTIYVTKDQRLPFQTKSPDSAIIVG
jgi:hypothetical protein